MIWLVIYIGTLMVSLRLIGIAAEEKGKEDWHWWLISLAVWFGNVKANSFAFQPRGEANF